MRSTDDIAGKLQTLAFRLWPTRLASRTFGELSRTAASRYLVRPFARAMRIDVDEAELPIDAYTSLNAFFTRRLKPGARPIDPAPDAVVSPVDGRVSAAGICDGDRILQIKGIEYTIFDLLRDSAMSQRLEQGTFLTLYLSPRDYHRIHAPLDLEITGLGYMPGNLMPVNPPSVRTCEKLYTENERLIVYGEFAGAAVALALIGAHGVGSIRLSFHDLTTNVPGVGPTRKYFERRLALSRGDELGVFEMGSTVVLLFERGAVDLKPPAEGFPVRMGQRLGCRSK